MTVRPNGGHTPRGYTDIKTLAASSGVTIPALLALSRQRDPFFVGSPAQHEWAAWFADVWQRFAGNGSHLRRVHYRLLDQGVTFPNGEPYTNTSKAWDNLGSASRHARHLGLVAPDAVIDRRNESARQYRVHREWNAVPTSRWEAPDVFRMPITYTPTMQTATPPQVSGYEYDLGDQPVGIEVWVEKSGVDDVLDPLCRRLGVNLLVGTGYESITQAVELLQERTDQPTRIFYVSDHDPAGRNMPVALSRQVEFYRPRYAPTADIKVRALVLTSDQIEEYELPHAPGEVKVELDALEALHPGVIGDIVEEAVEEWRDDFLESRLDDAHRVAQEAVDAEWQTMLDDTGLGDRLAELAEREQTLREEFAPRVAALNREFAAAYGPLVDEHAEVVAELSQAVEDLDVDLPDRPDGELPDVDTDEWLFDSDRHYFDQLAAYKRHKHGDEDGEGDQ
jgi:hypothetical protein